MLYVYKVYIEHEDYYHIDPVVFDGDKALQPGQTKNVQIKLGMNFKLSKCVKFPQANMTDEQIAEFEKELLALD